MTFLFCYIILLKKMMRDIRKIPCDNEDMYSVFSYFNQLRIFLVHG